MYVLLWIKLKLFLLVLHIFSNNNKVCIKLTLCSIKANPFFILQQFLPFTKLLAWRGHIFHDHTSRSSTCNEKMTGIGEVIAVITTADGVEDVMRKWLLFEGINIWQQAMLCKASCYMCYAEDVSRPLTGADHILLQGRNDSWSGLVMLQEASSFPISHGPVL